MDFTLCFRRTCFFCHILKGTPLPTIFFYIPTPLCKAQSTCQAPTYILTTQWNALIRVSQDTTQYRYFQVNTHVKFRIFIQVLVFSFGILKHSTAARQMNLSLLSRYIIVTMFFFWNILRNDKMVMQKSKQYSFCVLFRDLNILPSCNLPLVHFMKFKTQTLLNCIFLLTIYTVLW